MIPGVFLGPCNSFSIFLSIRPLCYVLSVSIFYSKIILLPLHPLVGLSSCILHLLVGIIFFRNFGISCFICIVWRCISIFWAFFLSPIYFDLFFLIVLSNLSAVLFWSFHPNMSRCIFPSLGIFAYCRSFLTCPFSLISQFYNRLVPLLHKLAQLIQ